MKLGPHREAEIEELEQARLRRLPLAVHVGGYQGAPGRPRPAPSPPAQAEQESPE
jgi:hypothetical protein